MPRSLQSRGGREKKKEQGRKSEDGGEDCQLPPVKTSMQPFPVPFMLLKLTDIHSAEGARQSEIWMEVFGSPPHGGVRNDTLYPMYCTTFDQNLYGP